jgi:hypothetical protein
MSHRRQERDPVSPKRGPTLLPQTQPAQVHHYLIQTRLVDLRTAAASPIPSKMISAQLAIPRPEDQTPPLRPLAFRNIPALKLRARNLRKDVGNNIRTRQTVLHKKTKACSRKPLIEVMRLQVGQTQNIQPTTTINSIFRRLAQVRVPLPGWTYPVLARLTDTARQLPHPPHALQGGRLLPQRPRYCHQMILQETESRLAMLLLVSLALGL